MQLSKFRRLPSEFTDWHIHAKVRPRTARAYLVQGPKDAAVRTEQQLLRRRDVPGANAETSQGRGGEGPQETLSSAHRLV